MAKPTELLDCAMCDAPDSFVISPVDPSAGYCFAEQTAWRIWLPMPTSEASVAWAEEADRIAGILRELSDRFNRIDAGYCTICHGHRLYDTRGRKGPCENGGCLSHRIEAILKNYESPSGTTLDRMWQYCLDKIREAEKEGQQ